MEAKNDNTEDDESSHIIYSPHWTVYLGLKTLCFCDQNVPSVNKIYYTSKICQNTVLRLQGCTMKKICLVKWLDAGVKIPTMMRISSCRFVGELNMEKKDKIMRFVCTTLFYLNLNYSSLILTLLKVILMAVLVMLFVVYITAEKRCENMCHENEGQIKKFVSI